MKEQEENYKKQARRPSKSYILKENRNNEMDAHIDMIFVYTSLVICYI